MGASARLPLISIIIPCYNHEQYLAASIESVLVQSHKNFEIIVVDDGSTDNSKLKAQQFLEVNYIYQKNGGLSAARNTGIKNSRGEYLVFLDADDWLQHDALLINLEYLQQNSNVAFVSGAHLKVTDNKDVLETVSISVPDNHYCHFLQGNYVGMHATVMYCRWVFDEFLFDTTLKACEDYDLYLKIARLYPVLHHTRQIALYRIHQQNMSGNIPMMLASVLFVLRRQKKHLRNKEEKRAYRKGQRIWKEYYCEKLYRSYAIESRSKPGLTIKTAGILFKHKKSLYIKFIAKQIVYAFQTKN